MVNSVCCDVLTLAELPIGASAVITGVKDALRGRKKFADAGIVPGAEITMESHAPLGSLLRVKLLGSSITVQKNDCKNILVKVN